MAIALVRVDDRLIHGQVVAVWLRALDATRIVVVDDAVAADEFLRDVLVLAAPRGVAVEVLDLAAAILRLPAVAADDRPTLVLVRTPVTALRLREAGVPFALLNVGGLGSRPGRLALYRTISADAEERAAMRALERLGTRVELRIVAADRPVPFGTVDRDA